ncbi:hypothetical protein, partial [Methanobrevibacter sp.]
MCLLFSVAGISAADVDNNTINDKSTAISEVTVPEVDDSATTTEVTEDTNDISDNDITENIETNEKDDGSTESQSSNVVENKESKIVENKNSQILTASNNGEIVGQRWKPNYWDMRFNGITFSNGVAHASWWAIGTSWDDDNLLNNLFLIDGYRIKTLDKISEDEPEGGYYWTWDLPSNLKLAPGKHIAVITGWDEDDGGDTYYFDQEFQVYDGLSSFTPNFNATTITYGEKIKMMANGITNNYKDINPSHITYTVEIDGVRKYEDKKLGEELLIDDILDAGSHKIRITTHGSYIWVNEYEYY